MSLSQGTGLSLFTSKEQEYEQRAQLLKRLAFTVFCSETDQYVRAMPDIQGTCAPCPIFKVRARHARHPRYVRAMPDIQGTCAPCPIFKVHASF